MILWQVGRIALLKRPRDQAWAGRRGVEQMQKTTEEREADK